MARGEKTMISDTLVGMTLTGRERRHPCLVQFSGIDIGRPHFIGSGISAIGRDPRVEVFVSEQKMSKRHCEVRFDKTGVMIADTGSTNGTFVNRRRLKDKGVMLKDGDMVTLGSTTFKFFAPGNVEQLFYDKVYKEKTIDQKTKVFNDKYLMSHLRSEVDASRAFRRKLSVIIYDLDHFKKVNDTYGHVFGDHVLQKTAELVSDAVRKKDALCRYGGEEFVIVLPETELATAVRLAERIRKIIATTVFQLKKRGRVIKHLQTISMGVAQMNQRTADPIKLLKAADKMLYKSKQTGRDRVSY